MPGREKQPIGDGSFWTELPGQEHIADEKLRQFKCDFCGFEHAYNVTQRKRHTRGCSAAPKEVRASLASGSGGAGGGAGGEGADGDGGTHVVAGGKKGDEGAHPGKKQKLLMTQHFSVTPKNLAVEKIVTFKM